MVVELESKEVRVVLVSNGHVMNDSIKCDISNSDWHRVSMTVTSNTLQTQLFSNNCPNSDSSLLTLSRPLASYIFIGNLQSYSSDFRDLVGSVHSQMGIDGCIRNVTINGVLQDLQPSSDPYSDHDPPPATPGCRRDNVCSPNPCSNDGTCLASWSGFQCICVGDYQGDDCKEVAPVSFNGNTSIAQFRVDESLLFFGTSGSLSFRTRDLNGILMHAGWHPVGVATQSDDYLNLEIVDGEVHLVINLGHGISLSFIMVCLIYVNGYLEYVGPGRVRISKNVSDGVWHSLQWQRMGKAFSLTLDDSVMENGTTLGSSSVLNVAKNGFAYVHIGGLEDYSLVSSRGMLSLTLTNIIKLI